MNRTRLLIATCAAAAVTVGSLAGCSRETTDTASAPASAAPTV